MVIVAALVLAGIIGAMIVAVVQDWYGRAKIAMLSSEASTRFAEANAGLTHEVDRIGLIIIGDSRAAMWREPPAIPGSKTLVRGIGGETSVQTRARLEADALALKPRVVLVMTGINDLIAASHMPPLMAERVIGDLGERLAAIAAQVRATGTIVLIGTIAPPGRPSLLRRVVWRNSVGEMARKVNTALRQEQALAGVLFDISGLLDVGESIELDDRWRHDTFHLTESAYDKLNNELKQVIYQFSKILKS